jgi:hypothetical protein
MPKSNEISQVEARLKASAITSFGYGNVEMLSGLHVARTNIDGSCLKLESWQCSGPQADFKLGAKRAWEFNKYCWIGGYYKRVEVSP